jgi:hypothetical protein
MSFSLQSAVRSCDVNTGWATRIQSDRFLNPDNMVCIPWNHMNSKGQEVCPDSFMTKTAGCNSATDRVLVENFQRPQYMPYITLDASGIEGDIYGGNVSAHISSVDRQNMLDGKNKITGNFGLQFGSEVRYDSCGVNAYENAMGQAAVSNRQRQSAEQGYIQNKYGQAAGF